MLTLAARPSEPLFLHDTNTNTISLIQPVSPRWTRLNLVFPPYISIHRPSTLPPEVRELARSQYPEFF